MRALARIALAAAAVAVAPWAAAADPAPARAPAAARVQLRLEREPPPRHLRIRPRAAQAAAPAPAARRTPMPAAPDVSATSPERIEGIEGVRDVLQPISFSINLGYQVDGARATGHQALGAPAPRLGVDYANLRGYGFGEAFVSTRGLIFPSLSTYFSARFQAARRLEIDPDELEEGEELPSDRALASPIATWFERSGAELRTGWAEVKNFLPRRWGLEHLRVRAGDQFIYGPWIVHLSGLHVAYEGPTLTVAAYSGQRRADYQRDLDDNQPFASGGTFRLDLRGLTDKVPLAFEGEYLRVTSSAEQEQPRTESAQLQVDWRPRRDVAVIGQQRWLARADGEAELASQHVEVRTRYKDVTNLVFELLRRFEADWRWDPTLVARTTELTEAKRYLDFGPVRPQLLISARGGTLIAENLDLFARIAAAPQLGDHNPTVDSYSASYLELAGALEMRVRRRVALGVSVLSRNTERLEEVPIVDERAMVEPFPVSGSMGEEGFIEAGTTVRMTLGARRFSALVELYGRRTRYTRAYRDDIVVMPVRDLRGGGRFTVDAWIGNRLRLFASYDVSSVLDTAPEISGYKSLRLVMSGVY
jgi:hypothetical protein